ncbi:MAG: hypothetical protein KTR21_11325 [Rhodobacteraceae bacterium]|nr:hypothetical protein [Paracoccaceae bacterium]
MDTNPFGGGASPKMSQSGAPTAPTQHGDAIGMLSKGFLAPSTWSGVDLQRVLISLLVEELGRIRRQAVPPQEWAAWTKNIAIDDNGVGVDRQGRRDMSARVSEFFHLHETGAEQHLKARRRLGDWIEVAKASLESCGERVTFQTSGEPEPITSVTHKMAGLVLEADFFIGELMKQSNWPERIVARASPHQVYGFLFTALGPSRLDADLWDTRLAGPSWLGQCRAGDVVVGTADQWEMGLHCLGEARIDGGVTGVISGAATSSCLSRKLLSAGLERLIEVYGSSQTAGLGWRDEPEAPFQLLPRWRRCEENPQRLLKAACAAAVGAPEPLEWLDARRFRPIRK